MPSKLRLAYFAHSLRSDWNNGNAHFLRGLMRALMMLGHEVAVFEPLMEWSIDNLEHELLGDRSLTRFAETYPELPIKTYTPHTNDEQWRESLRGFQIIILHEWNPPALAQTLLRLRNSLGFQLLFHDTHHRASSSPEQMRLLDLGRFDGILAFGEALRALYRERFGLTRVWILHEAADTTVFRPVPDEEHEREVVWIGNWGEGERSDEIRAFLLQPAAALGKTAYFTVFGVRYPPDGLAALQEAGVDYGGYLPNLDAPTIYARSALTVHIPRQQYTSAMTGIPTIRVFEALACRIPLISAPWHDTEQLFRPGDFLWARTPDEMLAAMRHLLNRPDLAAEQAERGLATVLARHTCDHRARELTAICEEIRS